MIPLLLLGSALGATYNVDVCARIGVDFVDVDSSNGDDYLTSNTSTPARGVHLKVIQQGIPQVTVANQWAQASGAQAGCLPTTLVLDSTKSYTTVVYSEPVVNGQTVEVFQDNTGTVLTTYTSGAWSPSSSGTWTTTTTGAYQDWNILAAGAYAVWRDDLANANGTLTAYSQQCPSGGSSCFQPTSPSGIYIRDTTTAYQYKYQVAHEFGHALMYGRYPNSGANNAAAPGGCLGDVSDTTGANGHHFISKEYQGEAFWEGFANYYATASYNNNTTETDCAFGLYKTVDWDRDTTDEEPVQFVDCVSPTPTIADPGDSPTSFTVDAEDYLGAYCYAVICAGAPNCNRGTELDWVRFLWYLDTQGMSPADIADIYAETRTNGGGYASTGNGYGSGYPAYELAAGAARVSATWGTLWANNDDVYGIHR